MHHTSRSPLARILLALALMAGVLAPLPAAAASTGGSYIAIIGDFGDDSPGEAAVASMIAGRNPDAVVTVGDNRQKAGDYDTLVNKYYCAFIADGAAGPNCSGDQSPINRFFPAIGNHDAEQAGGVPAYLDSYTLPGAGITSSRTSGSERYYDVVLGDVQFFILDAETGLMDADDLATQKEWLRVQLAASTTPWQVVVTHHAPYSSGPNGSFLDLRWPYAAWGADAVLSGHDHVFERLEADGIPYFVNGLGGSFIHQFATVLPESQFQYQVDFGAMFLEADETHMTFEFRRRSGYLIHSHTVEAPAQPTNQAPVAAFDVDTDGLEASFVDTSTDADGSIVARSWSFGDGATSSATNPTHTYADAGTYPVTLTVTDDDGATTSTSQTVTVDRTVAAAPLHLSFKATVTLGGVTVRNEDIITWDGAKTYTQTFDGSDVGLFDYRIDGFDVISDDTVLLSFDEPVVLPDLGAVDESDIVRFTGGLGAYTWGTFSMFFDGSDVGLDGGSEDVDGLDLLDDGRLLVSTEAGHSVTGVRGKGGDEDILAFTGTFGDTTSGSFVRFFDGTDVELQAGSEDVDAVAFNGTDLLLSTVGNLAATGITSLDEDVVRFMGTFGDDTAGRMTHEWVGLSNGTGVDLGGVAFA